MIQGISSDFSVRKSLLNYAKKYKRPGWCGRPARHGFVDLEILKKIKTQNHWKYKLLHLFWACFQSIRWRLSIEILFGVRQVSKCSILLD